MRKHILLVTTSPDERWAQLVRLAAEKDGDFLTVIDPDHVDRGAHCQQPGNVDFDLALVDSATIMETANTVDTLRSLEIVREIIVLTAAPGWRQAREIFLAGAHDYLIKSYDVAELRRIIMKSPTVAEKQDN
jgi:DNA-binding response OmpR family regulator